MVTVSEGAHPKGGEIHESGEEDAYGHKKLGGIGHAVAQEIKRRSGVNVMYEQLAYIMRSGAPDSLDRMVAVSYGSLALDQVAMGHTGRMVALQQGIYTTVPLDMVVTGKKRVDVTALYDSQGYRPRVSATCWASRCSCTRSRCVRPQARQAPEPTSSRRLALPSAGSCYH